MRIVVLADTHVRSKPSDAALRAPPLPPPVYAALRRADVILHAGDVVAPHLLAELEAFAPVFAVLGNNDHELVDVLPELHRAIEVLGRSVGPLSDLANRIPGRRKPIAG